MEKNVSGFIIIKYNNKIPIKKEVNGKLTNICINEKPSHYYFDSTGDDGNGAFRECFEKAKGLGYGIK